MSPSLWIRTALVARGIPFEERSHPAADTAQQVAHLEHVSGHRVAKVVVALADGRPVELILPASRRVDLARVRAALGARAVRLASEQEMALAFTDCEVGAVPALRHWDVPVVMDRLMAVEGDILFLAGTHTDAVRVPFRDWFEAVRPQVAPISQAETAS